MGEKGASKFGVEEGKKGGNALKHCWAHDIGDRERSVWNQWTALEEHI